jgi:hypothetical protein
MAAASLSPYRVSAFNTAHDSENKIHDDATARKFGFGGGLVPGVDVYGYMSHMPVTRWGRDWLEHGKADCRFFKPVYDGDEAIVTATESADGLEIIVESRGEICARGHASLGGSGVSPPPVSEYRQVPQRKDRPVADEASLPMAGWLGLDPYPITPQMAQQYLSASGETATIYAEHQLVHPREILRSCNFVLSRNVVLGPWIHTGSRIQLFTAVAVGSTLSVRARITGNYEHKGHRFVEIDALVLANGATPAARVEHIAIYLPRQVAAAA